MFLQSFRVTAIVMAQVFILGATGYFLTKKKVLGDAGLDALSRLSIEITLPVLIFCQLIKDFSFALYPNWWIFPLISLIITAAGLGVGILFLGFIKGPQHRLQFLSLSAFQNSGYLPLILVATLFGPDKLPALFIYLFLFMMGFNLLMFSLGVYLLTFHQDRKFDLKDLFSPPVVATIFSLLIVFLGLNRFIPDAVIKPLRLIGDCTLVLGMLVVGGNLAQISLKTIDKKAIFFVILGKMVLLPLLGLWLILKLKFPELIGFLIFIQLAMPPATSNSVIIRHYKKEDLLVSQGVFFGHIASLITLPVFLSLYFSLIMIR